MERRDNGSSEDVVRARRFELVDDEGRARVILGDLESPDSEESLVGLRVLDGSGASRISIGLGRDGAWMLVELEGNGLVHFGVNDPGSDAIGARSYFYLCDRSGVPAVGWRVADDGTVTRWEGSEDS